MLFYNDLVLGYDAEDLRYELEENGKFVRFIFSGDEAVYEESNDDKVRYIRGHQLVSSDSESARTYYHYASDERGSVTHILDDDNVLQNHYEYDAFGCITDGFENVHNRFTYTGQMYDATTGQYYLRARYYNPVIARFTQEDSYHGDGMNLYVYCAGNPLKYVDPSGHNFEICDQGLRNLGFDIDGGGNVYFNGEIVAHKSELKVIHGDGYTAIINNNGDYLITCSSNDFYVATSGGVSETSYGKLSGSSAYQTSYGKSSGSSAYQGSTKTGKYQVGLYEDIKGVEGIDAHHVGQKAIMKKLVKNYDYQKAPAINVPKVGHTISGPNGIVSRSMKGITNARQLLARDLFELKRVYPDIPNSKFSELIDLNMELYPEMRK